MLNKYTNRLGAYVSASISVGLMTGTEAHAGNSFTKIGTTITSQINGLPGLATSLAYISGLTLGILGIMKIKDHVENPSNTPLKDGAIRLAAGGALFAVPIVTEAAQNLIGIGGAGVAKESMQGINNFNAVK